MPLINSNTLNEWAMGIPQRARGLLADIKDAPRQIGLLFDPKFQKGLLDQRSVTDTFNKSKAEQLAMDLMTTTPAGGIAGTFIGKGAKTWNSAANAKAMQMAEKGVDPRNIWKETGNWKAPDGMWRQEIPDNLASFDLSDVVAKKKEGDALVRSALDQYGFGSPQVDDAFAKSLPHTDRYRNMVSGQAFNPVSEYMSHPSLYAAYDEIGLTPTSLDMQKGAIRGGAYLDNNKIKVTADNFDEAKSTTIHELQHAIQQREGWARGGSPENAPIVAEDMLSSIRAQKKQLGIDPYALMNKKSGGYRITPEEEQALERYRMLTAQEDDVLSNRLEPYEAYRRLAGEAEARATQARMNMDMAQRLNTFPEDSYDVPISQLIIRGLLER